MQENSLHLNTSRYEIPTWGESQIWIITIELTKDRNMFCGLCCMEGKKCLHYKRLGTTGHLVKLQQWNWMCKVWGLVIFDKAPGTLILTVMNMHNSHWWNQVLSSHEWEVPFICPVLLHIWHWNDHSPITHNLYDSSEVKKEGEADFLS